MDQVQSKIQRTTKNRDHNTSGAAYDVTHFLICDIYDIFGNSIDELDPVVAPLHEKSSGWNVVINSRKIHLKGLYGRLVYDFLSENISIYIRLCISLFVFINQLSP